MTSAEVREKLLGALGLDLVGPIGEVSPYAREKLEQSPSQWYLTGFLVPRDRRVVRDLGVSPLQQQSLNLQADLEEEDEQENDMDDAAAERWHKARETITEKTPPYFAQMATGISLTHREYLQRNERRQRMIRAWEKFFQSWDVLLTPQAASPAFPHDQAGERHERTIEVNGARVPVTDQMFWAGLASFYLLPGTVAPLGLSKSGLPYGVQILGGIYQDRTTIEVAKLLEKSWRAFTPPPGWE